MLAFIVINSIRLSSPERRELFFSSGNATKEEKKKLAQSVFMPSVHQVPQFSNAQKSVCGGTCGSSGIIKLELNKKQKKTKSGGSLGVGERKTKTDEQSKQLLLY